MVMKYIGYILFWGTTLTGLISCGGSSKTTYYKKGDSAPQTTAQQAPAPKTSKKSSRNQSAPPANQTYYYPSTYSTAAPQQQQMQQQPVYQQPPVQQQTFNQPAPAPQTTNNPNTAGADVKLIPFTQELYSKLYQYGLDIKKVQFFIDQKIVLSRVLDSAKASVSSGIIRFQSGRYINEIIIPAQTPCVLENYDSESLDVSFEAGNNSLKFVTNQPGSIEYYIFSGVNWENGTAEVTYDNNVYRATCLSCSNLTQVRLAVKQADLDKIFKNTRTLQGRKVEGN
jgi:hypothetical protein